MRGYVRLLDPRVGHARAEGRRQQTPDRLGTWTRRLPRHFLHLEDGDATERLADRVFYR